MLVPDPVTDAYKSGLDLSLIRENLRKTPEERLNALQALYDFSVELRGAGDRHRRR